VRFPCNDRADEVNKLFIIWPFHYGPVLVCKIVSKPYWTCQFPHTGVRKGAVMALGQFCSVFHNLLQEAGAEDKTACMFILVFFFI